MTDDMEVDIALAILCCKDFLEIICLHLWRR